MRVTPLRLTALAAALALSACGQNPSSETAKPQNTSDAAASSSASVSPPLTPTVMPEPSVPPEPTTDAPTDVPTGNASSDSSDVPPTDPSKPAAPANRTVCPQQFFEIPAGSPRGGDAPQSTADLTAAIALFAQPGTSWGCFYTLDGADDTLLTDGVWVRGGAPKKLKKKWSNEAPMVDQLGSSASPGSRSTECAPSTGTPMRFVYARRSAAGVAHAVVDVYGCQDVRIVSDLGSRDLNNDDALVDTGKKATAKAVAELHARMAAG